MRVDVTVARAEAHAADEPFLAGRLAPFRTGRIEAGLSALVRACPLVLAVGLGIALFVVAVDFTVTAIGLNDAAAVLAQLVATEVAVAVTLAFYALMTQAKRLCAVAVGIALAGHALARAITNPALATRVLWLRLADAPAGRAAGGSHAFSSERGAI